MLEGGLSSSSKFCDEEIEIMQGGNDEPDSKGIQGSSLPEMQSAAGSGQQVPGRAVQKMQKGEEPELEEAMNIRLQDPTSIENRINAGITDELTQDLRNELKKHIYAFTHRMRENLELIEKAVLNVR